MPASSAGLPTVPAARPTRTRRSRLRSGPARCGRSGATARTARPVRFTDVAPNLYINNTYGGEGCSGTLGAEPWPFVTCRQWYTMLGRVWLPAGEKDPTYAHIGRWIKDQAAGRWHLIGIARLPIPATSFTGNSGFIETLSDGKVVRPLHRRFGYCRKDGRWLKSDTIAIDKFEYVVVNTVPEGDHEYAAIEYCRRSPICCRASSPASRWPATNAMSSRSNSRTCRCSTSRQWPMCGPKRRAARWRCHGKCPTRRRPPSPTRSRCLTTRNAPARRKP